MNGIPTYDGWYEFWPKQPDTVPISNITIHPGDAITATVSGLDTNKRFSMQITDWTTNTSSGVHGGYPVAKTGTAEWIVEAPIFLNGRRLLMADFGSFQFNKLYATIDRQVHPLLSIPGAPAISVTMLTYTCDDGTVKAQPSQIERIENSFSVNWASGDSC